MKNINNTIPAATKTNHLWWEWAGTVHVGSGYSVARYQIILIYMATNPS